MSDVSRLMELARAYVPLPENVDVPAVMPLTATIGTALTCSMGNWNHQPDSYAYRWLSDGAEQVGASAEHIVNDADAGHSLTCVVTATSVIGSTEAPPSNAVAIAAAGGMARAGATSEEHERAGPPSARAHRPEATRK